MADWLARAQCCLRPAGDSKVEALKRESSRRISVIPPYGGKTKWMHPLELQRIVDTPTPDDRWWTAEHGWPKPSHVKFDDGQPPSILPSFEEQPAFRVPEEDIIGELHVELLEARNLEKMDHLSQNDIYAFFLLEECAAATPVMWNSDRPRWHVGCARALRFPVRRPCSALYVGLFDSDEIGIGLDDDDPIGRTVIHLPGLYANTVYDGWRPLQKTSVEAPSAENGEIRLRISVRWKSERRRLLAYLEPHAPFSLPIEERRWRRAALATLNGKLPDSKFAWPVTRSYLYEAMEIAQIFDLISFAISHVMYYGSPPLSLFVLAVWQTVCIRPSLLPACLPLTLLILLECMYPLNSRAKLSDVRRLPSFWKLLYAFCSDRLGGIRADALPAPPAQETFPLFVQELEKLNAEMAPQSSLAANLMSTLTNSIENIGDTLTQAVNVKNLQSVPKGVSGFGRSGLKMIQRFHEGTTEAIRDINLNPLALLEPYLSPVQLRIASMMREVRKVRSLFLWADPIASSWFYVMLFGATLFLVVLSPFLQIIMQVSGLLALGPHMWVLGARKRKQARELAEEAKRLQEKFAQADEEGRRQQLRAKRLEMKTVLKMKAAVEEAARLAAHKKELDKLHKMKPHERALVQMRTQRDAAWRKRCNELKAKFPGQESEVVLEVPSWRLADEKHLGELDPHCARAYPL